MGLCYKLLEKGMSSIQVKLSGICISIDLTLTVELDNRHKIIIHAIDKLHGHKL
jgi:hypothetical protein